MSGSRKRSLVRHTKQRKLPSGRRGLKGSLAAYAAVAAATTASGGEAQAEILYTDIPDVILDPTTAMTAFDIDLDGDGDPDFEFNAFQNVFATTSVSAAVSASSTLPQPATKKKVKKKGARDVGVRKKATKKKAAKVQAGQSPSVVRKKAAKRKVTRKKVAKKAPSIGSARAVPASTGGYYTFISTGFLGFQSFVTTDDVVGSIPFAYGTWFTQGAGRGYVGAYLIDNSDNINYGWIGIEFVDQGGGLFVTKITDWAYETDPFTPITTGDVPEPGSIAMLALGAAGVASRRKRKAA